jgi:hypothetical protein
MFSIIVLAMTDMETRHDVTMMYLPISGSLSDDLGVKSSSMSWKRLRLRKTLIVIPIFSVE